MLTILPRIRTHFPKLLVLALVSLAVFALTIHRAIDEHSAGQSCELCIGLDRLATALGSAALAVAVFAAFSCLIIVADLPAMLSHAPAVTRARGPPTL